MLQIRNQKHEIPGPDLIYLGTARNQLVSTGNPPGLFRIDAEIADGISEAYILNHLPDQFHIIRQLTVLYVISEHVAQHTPEVLMPWIREKAP